MLSIFEKLRFWWILWSKAFYALFDIQYCTMTPCQIVVRASTEGIEPQTPSDDQWFFSYIFHDSNQCYGAGHFFRSAPRLLKSRWFRLRLLKSRRFRLRLLKSCRFWLRLLKSRRFRLWLFFWLKMLSELPRIVSFILTIVKYVNMTNIALNINTVHCINNIRKQKPAPAFAKPTRGLWVIGSKNLSYCEVYEEFKE